MSPLEMELKEQFLVKAKNLIFFVESVRWVNKSRLTSVLVNALLIVFLNFYTYI